MNGKQNQSVESNSTAIQASGDVHIVSGMSAEQMIQIISTISNHVERLTSEARTIVDERLERFQEKLLRQFSPGSGGRMEAFSDPDFQASVYEAQKSFARSGDEELGKVLADLIRERSKQHDRTRRTLVLNDAIAKAGSLTTQDFNALALIFVLHSVFGPHIGNINSIGQHYKALLDDIVTDLPQQELAYRYLAAHNCVTIGMFAGDDVFARIESSYPHILTKGVTEEELKECMPDIYHPQISSVSIQSPFDPDLIVLRDSSKANFERIGGLIGAPEFFDQYVAKAKNRRITQDEFLAAIDDGRRTIEAAIEAWDGKIPSTTTLTSLGIVLAHARLSEGQSFNADLGIWIE